MSDKIRHKRSLTPGSVPTVNSLDLGELAINVPDGKIYTRSSGSNGDVIVSIVSANTVTNGSIETTDGFTGSLSGTASYSISSSVAQIAYYVETAQTASYVIQSISSSFAQTASYALNGGSGGSNAASNLFNYYNFI